MATFADKPTLTGQRVILRPMVEGDAEAFLASMDEGGMRLTGTHRTFTLAELLAWAATRNDAHDRLDLSVVEKSSGQWIGELAINDWDADNRSCGFRIALGPDGRNRGLGTEATRLVVDYVFTHLPIHRIGLEVFAFNPRATHVYESVGFIREGVMRDALLWDGTYTDTVVMGLLRTDWLTADSGDRGASGSR
jgi:RimJ/RimL family protein N-acetyltransferase